VTGVTRLLGGILFQWANTKKFN